MIGFLGRLLFGGLESIVEGRVDSTFYTPTEPGTIVRRGMPGTETWCEGKPGVNPAYLRPITRIEDISYSLGGSFRLRVDVYNGCGAFHYGKGEEVSEERVEHLKNGICEGNLYVYDSNKEARLKRQVQMIPVTKWEDIGSILTEDDAGKTVQIGLSVYGLVSKKGKVSREKIVNPGSGEDIIVLCPDDPLYKRIERGMENRTVYISADDRLKMERELQKAA